MRVAVVGLGAWGSMTAWRLAAAGADVVGFEAHAIGHDRGSSHGATRLYRRLCVEHAGLVPLAERSAALWRDLEERAGERLLTVTGGVSVGPADSVLVRDSLAVATAAGVSHEVLDATRVRERWPMLRVADDAVGVVDPAAGILAAEPSVLAAAAAARAAGATLREGTRVDARDAAEGVLHVAGRRERFDQVVIAAGAWTGELVPGLGVTPTRTLVTWFAPRRGHEQELSAQRLGVVVAAVGDAWMWGHGALPGGLVKLGPADDPAFVPIRPDDLVGSVDARDGALVSRLAAAALPGVDSTPAHVRPCMYGRTADHQFVVGRVGPRLLVAGGCNGHGFKHAAAIGEHLAELALGEVPTVPMPFADPRRVASVVDA
ncbi:N-methyl-L-tryptophan oxidase [Agrococcus sp. SGAir0287]|uniref:N-methyl-L-tryptophan oxidase n=1 Tax=Agrococcus sp. SGAir0287 TaxID=2070347 RepID=UPI0010CD4B38|nr:N-methyl-L-tryptophan oxidase [Agrococcus sp. SGAir0287]QCR19665.1 N-methyl-L-tryptophan oxidase [Agrococcus sp. SGAir0287]